MPVAVVRFSNDYDYALVPAAADQSTVEIERADGKPIGRVSVSPKKLNLVTRTVGPRV
ncbi:MAG: hypothetical protein JWM57_3122, partial [Phycisphaerales bacterium]|nr:hypothetical protein [Phycisphaerales bacterium]